MTQVKQEIDDDMVLESFSPTTRNMLCALDDDSADDLQLRQELLETRRLQLARGHINVLCF